jgi:hypothetical protein
VVELRNPTTSLRISLLILQHITISRACCHSDRRYFIFVVKSVLSRLAQAVMLLSCVWEVPGSNLRQDTDYPG